MLQLTISEIDNGYLIGIPPTRSVIESAQRNGGQPQGTAIYAKDFLEVVNALKEQFPDHETRSIVIRDTTPTVVV